MRNTDTQRIDWLADTNNRIGLVQLPKACVVAHADSLRDAIDAAMRLCKKCGLKPGCPDCQGVHDMPEGA
jgi:hypothetical protein